MRTLRPSSAALVLLALACSPTTSPTSTLPPGLWGGDRVNLIVTRDSARVEMDCASGRLEAPVPLDPVGRFAVAGTYRPEYGPTGPSFPARWSGKLESVAAGSVITLTAQVTFPNQPPQTLGPFELHAGQRVTTYFCA